mgnify:CR=1 FL=1
MRFFIPLITNRMYSFKEENWLCFTIAFVSLFLYSSNISEFLKIEAGGSLLPPSHETVDKKQHYVYQDGKNVFKYAVSMMADVSEQVVKRNNLTNDDIDWLVPHQANKRIIGNEKKAGINIAPKICLEIVFILKSNPGYK